MSCRLFITVAEVSGDVHAAELIKAIRQLDPSVNVDGIGGARMAEAGAHIVHESVGAAAMGWRGALRAIEVVRLLKLTRKRFADPATRADLHICIDSSAMNLPFAKMASSMGVPVLYYIAPQLWASREGRMRKLRTYVDRVACILPFEEKYFRANGVDASFVGHPLFDELPSIEDRLSRRGSAARFPDAAPIIGIIPGSRRQEVISNLPPLLEVADAIKLRFPGARFLIPTTEAVHPIVIEMLHGRGDDFEHTIDAFDGMVPRCDLCLCKSGTSTLHVAAFCVPMIVVYRVNPVERVAWQALGRWVVKTKKIALVNILAGNVDLVPEFVPWYGPTSAVIDCALDLLTTPGKLDEQRRQLYDLIVQLDHPGASINTARLALEMINGKQRERSASDLNCLPLAK